MKTQLPDHQQSPNQPPAVISDTTLTEDSVEKEQFSYGESVDVRPPEELERCFIFGYN